MLSGVWKPGEAGLRIAYRRTQSYTRPPLGCLSVSSSNVGEKERFCSCLLLYCSVPRPIPQLAVCVNSAATGVLATDGIQNLFLFPEKKSFVDQSDGNRMLPFAFVQHRLPCCKWKGKRYNIDHLSPLLGTFLQLLHVQYIIPIFGNIGYE